ncbi:MAG: caspase family protein [Pararhodobacter sp.]|nr:caspase family protein [Pararhodobacter sp.]
MIRILALLAALLPALPALAQSRHALVIGIDDYAHVEPLQKAGNDARAMARALEQAGFAVDLQIDVGEAALLAALNRLARRAGPGDEVVVFFAGHGVELDGQNYLLPADVPALAPGEELIIRRRSIPVSDITDELSARQVRISLLILDACRDNPFPRQGTRSLGGSRGLARMEAPEGTFILYSAGAGQAALDRLSNDDPDPNSVFTRTLLPRLGQPGLGLREVTAEVRSEVRRLAASVGHPQFPAVYDQLDGDFLLLPAAATLPLAPPQDDACDAARRDWALIADSGVLPAYEHFIAAHDGCPMLTALAQARLAAIPAPDAQAMPDGGEDSAEEALHALRAENAALREYQRQADQELAALEAERDDDHRRLAVLNRQVEALRGQVTQLQELLGESRMREQEALTRLAETETQMGEEPDAAQVQLDTLGAELNAALARLAMEQRSRADLEHAEARRRDLASAAEAGDGTAMATIGLRYAEGQDGAQSERNAAYWLLRAAVAGDGSFVEGLDGGWSAGVLREAQRILRHEGHYSGTIDGRFGPQSRQALQRLVEEGF